MRISNITGKATGKYSKAWNRKPEDGPCKYLILIET